MKTNTRLFKQTRNDLVFGITSFEPDFKNLSVVCLFLLFGWLNFGFSVQAQTNLLLPANGGELLNCPSQLNTSGLYSCAAIHDGNLTHDGWSSSKTPKSTQSFDFQFDAGQSVTINNFTIGTGSAEGQYWSENIKIYVSSDAGTNWTEVITDNLPANNTTINYPVSRSNVNRVRLSIESGHNPQYWQLGEFQVFGTIPLDLSTSVTPIPCGSSTGGAIDLSVSGGKTPYTYSWSNGATTQDISSLAAGNYTVTVTDANGQAQTLSETIDNPDIDSDGDGVCDEKDLDDDNDGILDVDEKYVDIFESWETDPLQPNINTNNFVGTTFGDWYTQNGAEINLIRVDGTGYASGADVAITGSQYLDISGADDFPILPFTVTGQSTIDASAWFSNREEDRAGYKAWDARLEILDNNFNVISSGPIIAFDSSISQENWLQTSLNTTVTVPGTYYIRLFVDDYGHLEDVSLKISSDTDKDGIADHLDLDSDNDGVYDAIEAGADPSLLDENGRIDISINGVNEDGVPLDANGGAGFTVIDTDGDGIANFHDLDSDGDGCSDANEFYFKADADGRDGGEFGKGTPGVIAGIGSVTAATYDGSTYADALDHTITRGCQFIQTTVGNWDSNSNWDARTVPISTDDAIIRAHSTVTQTQNVNKLTVDAGYTVSVNADQTVHVKADLTNNGDFQGEGYLVFDGSVSQKIIGDGTDAGSFTHMRVNNAAGVTLTDDADLYDVIDIDAGDFTVENGNFLTFKSSAERTAVVGEVNGGTLAGCVIVERYIPPKRAFRYIASPVTTTTNCGKPTIKDNLQEGQQVLDHTKYETTPANSDFGTHVTGTDLGTNLGFDDTQTGNPSMFTYDNQGQAWYSIANTNSLGLTVGTPYGLMIRGGRDMNLNINNQMIGTETILRFTGELATGNQPAKRLTTQGSKYNFIANPYQAQVHLGELLLNNAIDIQKAKVWVYDPTNAGAHGAYTFLEFESTGQLKSKTPSSSGANEFLQPNQSFFVENKATASNASVTFTELRKKNAKDQSTTTEVYRVESSSANKKKTSDYKVLIDLYEAETDDLRDGVQVRFGRRYKDDYDASEDAFKFWNSLESLATSLDDGNFLTLDKRHFDASDKVVNLFIWNYRATNYTFKMDINNPGVHDIYLVDHYLGTKTRLGTKQNSYSFSVDRSVPASTDAYRFQLNFEKAKQGHNSRKKTLGNDEFESDGIHLYPNPVKDLLTINLTQLTGEVSSLNVYDITGKLINRLEVSNPNSDIKINMENYSSGIYILKIDAKDGSHYQKKLIVE
ncbi:T9SS type A sorting domain-containing protein [Psychroflexus sp. CAK57W]|uniref:T9SS type A sorting domain-containing protein n=1 Tax=Psychroflexus curvus TaxID=2873595 RepID=UPI001CCE78E8|nr:T9SS type A sorting domain-containing protein [Psychroflexus curvus]MBZ9788311.1 T9SS type A sorting domain-containing protein [Psychroflexus curvus]